MINDNPKFISCPICGLNYYAPIERHEHDSYCKKYTKACMRFDTIINHEECETMKREADLIISSENRSVADKVIAFEGLFKAYFSRSVRLSGLSVMHPRFLDYVAMLLNQKCFIDFTKKFPEVRTLLIKKYGRKTGSFIKGSSTIIRCK